MFRPEEFKFDVVKIHKATADGTLMGRDKMFALRYLLAFEQLVGTRVRVCCGCQREEYQDYMGVCPICGDAACWSCVGAANVCKCRVDAALKTLETL